LGPVLESVSPEFAGKVEFIKVNIDDAQDIAAEYQVMSIPTMVIVKDGVVVDKKMGALGATEISA